MKLKILLFSLIAACLPSEQMTAYEADQYSNRSLEIRDATELLDERVNDALKEIIVDWRGPADDKKFARLVYLKLGGWYWVDKLERWTMDSPKLQRYPQKNQDSIYTDMPFWATRVNYFFGIGTSIKVNQVQVGSDKFGHFFSQGYKYYKRSLAGWDDERVFARGAYAERWLFGLLTTGAYSNADIVANYEGMRFYQSLSVDGVSDGKPALIAWQGSRPALKRKFTWRDHINNYWDEALNPSHVVNSIEIRLVPKIELLCGDFRSNPANYLPGEDDLLWARYEKIGLMDARHLRVDRVCARQTAGKLKEAQHTGD
jgi:hypothetical protein